MTKYRKEDGTNTEVLEEATVSLCNMYKGCGCVTKSILSEDNTHYICGKCGNTK